MCKFFDQILGATDDYKNQMIRTEKGKEIWDEMMMETKIHFIENHPSS